MGVSLANVQISTPFWIPPTEEENQEPEEEEIIPDEPEQEIEQDTGVEQEDLPQLEENTKEATPVKSCQTVTVKPSPLSYIVGMFLGVFIWTRRQK